MLRLVVILFLVGAVWSDGNEHHNYTSSHGSDKGSTDGGNDVTKIIHVVKVVGLVQEQEPKVVEKEVIKEVPAPAQVVKHIHHNRPVEKFDVKMNTVQHTVPIYVPKIIHKPYYVPRYIPVHIPYKVHHKVHVKVPVPVKVSNTLMLSKIIANHSTTSLVSFC